MTSAEELDILIFLPFLFHVKLSAQWQQELSYLAHDKIKACDNYQCYTSDGDRAMSHWNQTNSNITVLMVEVYCYEWVWSFRL